MPRGKRGEGLKQDGTIDGVKQWVARLYWKDPRDGRERERTVRFAASSLHVARLERARQLEGARNGTDPRAKDRRRFGEVADEWFATITTFGTTVSWGSHLRKLKARYGTQWMDMFTRRELQAYLDALDLAPGTVNSIRDVLKHVFKYAVRKGYVEGNPAAETERQSTRAPRTSELEDAPRRALTEDEAVALLAWFRDEAGAFYPVAVTQFVLGCRFGEVSELRWTDIDTVTGIVAIRRTQVRGRVGPTKGRYARSAALGPDGLALLLAHRKEMAWRQWPSWDSLVFPRPFTTRRKLSDHWSIMTAYAIYKRGLAAIGLDLPVASHLARHTMLTVASTFASAKLLRKVAGHRTEQMQANYLGVHNAEVINMASQLEKKFSQTGVQTGSRATVAKRRGPK